jgi:hypothetical protein
MLLKLSGLDNIIKDKYLVEWSIVATWDPEARYKPVGAARKEDAELMIESTKKLLKII